MQEIPVIVIHKSRGSYGVVVVGVRVSSQVNEQICVVFTFP